MLSLHTTTSLYSVLAEQCSSLFEASLHALLLWGIVVVLPCMVMVDASLNRMKIFVERPD